MKYFPEFEMQIGKDDLGNMARPEGSQFYKLWFKTLLRTKGKDDNWYEMSFSSSYVASDVELLTVQSFTNIFLHSAYVSVMMESPPFYRWTRTNMKAFDKDGISRDVSEYDRIKHTLEL